MTSSENRLIVVTGGGGGIGRATALLCAKRGDRIAILDKNGESAKRAADAARAEGASGSVGLACDVTDEAQVAGLRAHSWTIRRALRRLRQRGHRYRRARP
jgi:NAD(P)-dependent dehydrogenase (short-subunit alcohol dehydrogenase family)